MMAAKVSSVVIECTPLHPPMALGGLKRSMKGLKKFYFGPEQHITIVGNVFVNTMFIEDHSMMKVGKLMEEGFKRLGVTTILRYNQVLYYRYSSKYIDLEKKGIAHEI